MSPHPNQPHYKLSTFDSFFSWLTNDPEGGGASTIIFQMLTFPKLVVCER